MDEWEVVKEGREKGGDKSKKKRKKEGRKCRKG
jgi:hypothetical protein